MSVYTDWSGKSEHGGYACLWVGINDQSLCRHYNRTENGVHVAQVREYGLSVWELMGTAVMCKNCLTKFLVRVRPPRHVLPRTVEVVKTDFAVEDPPEDEFETVSDAQMDALIDDLGPPWPEGAVPHD